MNANGTSNTQPPVRIRLQRLATAAAVIVLSLTLIGIDRASAEEGVPKTCMPAALPQGVPMKMSPPGMFPGAPRGLMPKPLFPHGIRLTDAQDDKIFELMHAQMPAERELAKTASRALQDMRRLLGSDGAGDEMAREAAVSTYALAIVRLIDMHAKLEAKVRAILTPEQRKKMEDTCARGCCSQRVVRGLAPGEENDAM